MTMSVTNPRASACRAADTWKYESKTPRVWAAMIARPTKAQRNAERTPMPGQAGVSMQRLPGDACSEDTDGAGDHPEPGQQQPGTEGQAQCEREDTREPADRAGDERPGTRRLGSHEARGEASPYPEDQRAQAPEEHDPDRAVIGRLVDDDRSRPHHLKGDQQRRDRDRADPGADEELVRPMGIPASDQ